MTYTDTETWETREVSLHMMNDAYLLHNLLSGGDELSVWQVDGIVSMYLIPTLGDDFDWDDVDWDAITQEVHQYWLDDEDHECEVTC